MYRTVSQIDSATDILASWFPDVFARIQLPEASVEGRPVYALRMRAGGGAARRGVLIVGGTHARELMNPDAIVELTIDLFLSYANGTNISYGGRTWLAADVKLVLEALDIWLVPCSNPDGREYVMTVDDLWRKNRRVNPTAICPGVDLNRNADIVWGVAQGQTSCSPCSIVYCGPSAFSEPETRNIKYLLDSERVVSFVDVHSYSELVLYPWGHAPTQSSDSSQRFTGLTTGTCTASIPNSYSEYMPPIDVQRFQTVAQRIVDDVAAVRGRRYKPETAFALYATTSTQSDYAYSRHIADQSLNKTYGFTFETGPAAATVNDSFHPPDPTLIKQDTKAAILALLQQSVCAIELIGLQLFGSGAEVSALRAIRDDLLATTAAGRDWIALFERVQLPLASMVLRNSKLREVAAELLQTAAHMVGTEEATLGEAEAARASRFVRQLHSMSKSRTLRSDLNAVRERIDQMSGRRMRGVFESLMRHRPARRDALTRSTQAKRKPVASPRRRRIAKPK